MVRLCVVRYHKPTTAVQIEQLFVGPDPKMWSDELYGSVLKLTFNPFNGVNITPQLQRTMAVVHFPIPLNKRMYYAEWLVKYQNDFDFIARDMNTFPDSGGPQILSILEQARFIEQLPKNTKFTFKGFKNIIII